MNARDILYTEADFLPEKPRLGENFAWAVLDRKKPAANDCCIREKSEIRVRLASGKLFPGQYFDAETGLHYNYFRYYDPAGGRYTQRDRADISGGLNAYLYVTANPLNWLDQHGLWKTKPGWYTPKKPKNRRVPKPEKNYGKKPEIEQRIDDFDDLIEDLKSLYDNVCERRDYTRYKAVMGEIEKRVNSTPSCKPVYFSITWSINHHSNGCRYDFRVEFSDKPFAEDVVCRMSRVIDNEGNDVAGFFPRKIRWVQNCGIRNGGTMGRGH